MTRTVSIVLVGIGGYGNLYVDALLDEMEEKGVKIAGAVEPYPDGCRKLLELKKRNIPLFDTLDAFYENNSADLAVISSPIHFHNEQTCLALSKGSNVLCEKPVAASLSEAEQMLRARDKSDKFIAIGYQWSYSSAILELKKDILSGRFGKADHLKTIVLWPRNKSYYQRKWAGKVKDEQGRLILDSVANNATAHYLHNMFYILGNTIDTSASPVQVKAELYKANDIENFDTAAVYVKTNCAADLYYYASHAVLETYGPIFEYVFEKGVVSYDGSKFTGSIKATLNDGTIIDYNDPNTKQAKKLWDCIEAIRGEAQISCPIEAAIPHIACIESMHKSSEVREFPQDNIRYDINTEVTWAENLSDVLLQCYKSNLLPSEMGVNWAQGGKMIYL